MAISYLTTQERLAGGGYLFQTEYVDVSVNSNEVKEFSFVTDPSKTTIFFGLNLETMTGRATLEVFSGAVLDVEGTQIDVLPLNPTRPRQPLARFAEGSTFTSPPPPETLILTEFAGSTRRGGSTFGSNDYLAIVHDEVFRLRFTNLENQTMQAKIKVLFAEINRES